MNVPSSPDATPSFSEAVKSSCSGAIESVISTERICTGSTMQTTQPMSVRQWRR